MKHYLQVFLLLLVACDSPKNSKITETQLKVKDTKLLELNSTNPEFLHAIDKIKDYLIKLNVPIDSMYFVGVDSISIDHWEFRIIHYNNYLIQGDSEVEKRRIDSLEKLGVNEYYINIPPTGNRSGDDRTLV